MLSGNAAVHLGGETALPLMVGKVCGGPIYGWVTYHEEWLQDGFHPCVAYCYECTNHDVAMTTELKNMPWTLRVRCAHWAHQSDPFSRCNNCWQSCRIKLGIDQPLPSILAMGEEREQTNFALHEARADRARRSNTTRSLL